MIIRSLFKLDGLLVVLGLRMGVVGSPNILRKDFELTFFAFIQVFSLSPSESSGSFFSAFHP